MHVRSLSFCRGSIDLYDDKVLMCFQISNLHHLTLVLKVKFLSDVEEGHPDNSPSNK